MPISIRNRLCITCIAATAVVGAVMLASLLWRIQVPLTGRSMIAVEGGAIIVTRDLVLFTNKIRFEFGANQLGPMALVPAARHYQWGTFYVIPLWILLAPFAVAIWTTWPARQDSVANVCVKCGSDLTAHARAVSGMRPGSRDRSRNVRTSAYLKSRAVAFASARVSEYRGITPLRSRHRASSTACRTQGNCPALEAPSGGIRIRSIDRCAPARRTAVSTAP